jgi:hypothetical protein
MKYLLKYNLFLEENEFDIKDSDAEDVKMSKEKLNDLKNQISDYNQNKSKIVDLYKNANSIEEANEQLKKIIGEDSETRNPFLVQLANIERMSKEIDLMQDSTANDKIKIDDLKQELSLTKDDTTKKALLTKITDIDNRISERNKKITDKQKEVLESDKEHKEKMIKNQSEIQEWIKKISDLS